MFYFMGAMRSYALSFYCGYFFIGTLRSQIEDSLWETKDRHSYKYNNNYNSNRKD